jgi:hypothetical protein
MKTAADQWEIYSDLHVPAALTQNQRECVKAVFYSGMVSGLSALMATARAESVDSAVALSLLSDDFKNELLEWLEAKGSWRG